MSKLKTDMEVADFLLNHKSFSNVVVTHVEIIADIDCGISKKIIKDIEAVTDQDYYFFYKNQRIAIPRIVKSI